ncbi:uncharacterized protein IWZ02DRAFT_434562 [Phyllosticta citriasiana]|uniref:uncharacterized protein n=1 Tax=Phyllosticta citriasiana TaxID=595635 RepID=UPI0030FDAD55
MPLHQPTSLFYNYPEPQRIIVGHGSESPLHYESLGSDFESEAVGKLYASAVSQDVIEIPDQNAHEITLVQFFQDSKLEAMDDRESAYKAFDVAYRLVYPIHKLVKRPLSPDLEPETARKRRKVVEDNPLTKSPRDRNKICIVLKARLRVISYAVSKALHWIDDFVQAYSEIIVETFDGSSLSTFEDIIPMQYDLKSMVELAFTSQREGDFKMLHKCMEYASLMPSLEVFQELRRPIGRLLFQIQDMTNQNPMPLPCVNRERFLKGPEIFQVCTQRMTEQLKKLATHGLAVFNPFWTEFLEPLKAMADEEWNWWESASDEQQKDKFQEQWNLVLLDRQYLAEDRVLIEERIKKRNAYNRVEIVLEIRQSFDIMKRLLVELREFNKFVESGFRVKFLEENNAASATNSAAETSTASATNTAPATDATPAANVAPATNNTAT